MDFEKLMQKKVSRRDFLKSIGFIILALLLFPRKALSLIGESSDSEQKITTGFTNNLMNGLNNEVTGDYNKEFTKKNERVVVEGITIIEVEDD